MTSAPGTPEPDDPGEAVEPDEPADASTDDAGTDDARAAYDLDGDGTVSAVEAERARLGLVDARLEEIADDGGIKGHLAEAAHKLIDKLDND